MPFSAHKVGGHHHPDQTCDEGNGGQPVPVNYDMEKTADGWKVYDLLVEGVSLVTSYRGTFSDQIQQGGIDGLIKTLVEKNQAAASTKLQQAGSK